MVATTVSRPIPAAAFCATCIDGKPHIYTEVDDGRWRWLCRDCYDGADHSLPNTSVDIERKLYLQRIANLQRRFPNATTLDIAMMMEEDEQGGSNHTNLGTLRTRRAIRALEKLATNPKYAKRLKGTP